MWKSLAAAFTTAAVLVPTLVQAASADAFDKGMNTMWEVLWHQVGTPTRLVRWDKPIQVRVHGVNAAAHRKHTLQAIRAVAVEAGLKVIDVTDSPEAAQQANLSIEITANNMLQDIEPCATRLNYQTETTIDSVTMQMRDSDAVRCAYHEAMHAMGVRGHPEGETVLSYFPGKVDRLMALDKAMLRAWYSSQARPGMTPFEVLPVLADELVRILPNQQKAAQSRDRFFTRTVQEMQAFAEGKGDVPPIVKRCGKATEQGIRFGRMETSYFLGIAYQEGTIVARDDVEAARWLQRAASLGSRGAQARLSSLPATLGS